MTTDAEIEAAAKIICTELAGGACMLVHDRDRHLCDEDNCRIKPIVRRALAASARRRTPAPAPPPNELATLVSNMNAYSHQIQSKWPALAEECRFAAREIERLTALVPRWQPIDTAPRDGTRVLMCGPLDRMAVGWFNDDCDGRAMWDWDADGVPTDWMPLPAPPQKAE